MAGSGSSARSKARRTSLKKSQPAEVNTENSAAESSSQETSSKKSAAREAKGSGLYERISKFLVSVKDEMGRVSWPTGKELRAATIVTLVTLVLVSAYMGLVNKVLTLIFHTPEATGL